MSDVGLWSMEPPRSVLGGDYGRMLKYGSIVGHAIADNGDFVYRYMRATPYIPNLNFCPSALFVTNSFRDACKEASISGVRFVDVRVERLVVIDWSQWTDATWKYPVDLFVGSDADPESYFSCADEKSCIDPKSLQLWSVVFEPIDEQKAVASHFPVFFECGPGRPFSVNQAGKIFVEQRWPGEVTFEAFG